MGSKKLSGIAGMVFCFAFLLAAEPPLSVLAGNGQNSSTYEEYRSGANWEKEALSGEASYITVTVETEQDLIELAENCRLDVWSADKLVQLNADIVLQEHQDLYIPSFGGIFEGNGHKISNLYIEKEGSALGFFRYIREGGTVRNLTVEGKVLPEGTQDQAGGIAGVNYGKIYRCSFWGQVSGDTQVGGIAGVNSENGEIRQCQSTAIVLGNHSVGGICGENHGILNNCTNTGEINTFSTEVTYDLEDITMENLEDINSASNLSAHTDTGGIAGISDGKIYYCTNRGNVGYQHVGYNIGGIVGRLHQGYLQNCTNMGRIRGRKDVAGIAGQMEPFLQIQYLNDKLQELDRETDRFLDLVDAAHQDVSAYGTQASQLSKELTANLRGISGSAGNLTGTVNDLWYIYNQELTGIGNDLKTMNEELDHQKGQDQENGDIHDMTVSGGDQHKAWTIPAPDDLESYRAAVRKFGNSAAGHLTNMTGATEDRTGGISDNLKNMNDAMEAAGKNLELLTDILQEGTERTGDHVDALVEQAKVLRRLFSEIRDDLFCYEGITVADTSDEKASSSPETPGADPAEGNTEIIYDTTSFQQGKVTQCLNQGLIEADANVGGVVGQIATEFDFDPEDDITLTGAESFDIEQTVKAVVRDSRNLGEIVGKKDFAGGIVGKADFGAVISCESYGAVSSTGGSNVGGIAGASSYAVRSCYSMGQVSGKNNVGGIVGKGCDIFYSYAYNTLEATGEGAGAIAGPGAGKRRLVRKLLCSRRTGRH